MNNPFSADPKYALYPAPERVTGWNIWQMLQERIPEVTRSQYIRAFDRRNVLNAIEWSLPFAREESADLPERLVGRTVVLLGRQVLEVWRLPQVDPIVWQNGWPSLLQNGPRRWCYIPHPSGLNRWYNDPINRIAVGLRLEQLYMESIGA